MSTVSILPLCGPPEVQEARLQRQALTQFQSTRQPTKLNVERPQAVSQSTDGVSKMEVAFTDNCAVALSTSGSACLDFFFQVQPGTSDEIIFKLLDSAWTDNPEVCLKLIFQLGATRKGKQDRFSFYHALYWLSNHHPETLLHNLPVVEQAVYFKAMLEILAYMCEGGDDLRLYQKRSQALKEKIARGKTQKRLTLPKQHWKDQTLRVLCKYDSDTHFKAAYNIVADHFAKHLKKDLENMRIGKQSCSLAAKWAPSLDSGYDARTLLCEGIARRMFPKTLPEYIEISDEHYAYRIRDRLRKEVYVPLRQHLKCPEVFMTAGRWNQIDYTRVPSLCMKLRYPIFEKHDPENFHEYLQKVQKKEVKIASGAVLPHELLKEALKSRGSSPVPQLQWSAMVEDVKKSGTLTNCVVVCDVSGSMSSAVSTGVSALNVAVALTLLVSEVADEPWANHAITFSQNPQFQQIQGSTLCERYSSLSQQQWEMNTNFQKVFEVVLERAQQTQLPPSDMVHTVFVFSDMQFDQAAGQFDHHLYYDHEDEGQGEQEGGWKTSHEIVKQKFEDAGYPMPNIVYWNLVAKDTVPVRQDEEGTCLLSGFSANLLKVLMNDGEEGLQELVGKEKLKISPTEVMHKAISERLFEQLKVVD
eukprot:TRINITY_DN1160_c0_g1_i1.p1 TRINITY_DN1160_c0_g1~~TRINITY_DN1160_c0_g1_i1.p1  ORF type:complete len:643 (-),score=61.21 TRINITY_DN1160_c0_g1_i1:429-2357(-)